jgi:ribonuclease HIII
MTDSFVTNIDIALQDEIRDYLIANGFVITQIPYSIFSAKKDGVNLTLYKSGKLVVQGKDKDGLIKYYLEPEILKSLEYSYPEINIDKRDKIGVDEAGKGDFFGPLCIAGVFADEKLIDFLIKNGIKDSKKIGDPQIKKLASLIRSHCPHEIIALYPEKYNELYAKFKNLNSLLAWAHATVIEKLHEKTNCKYASIDQFASKHVVENALRQKKVELNLKQSFKGESDPVIAAASILARDAFVTGIEKLSNIYGVELPKGANHGVKAAAKKYIEIHSKDKLNLVAKLHFKTTDELE